MFEVLKDIVVVALAFLIIGGIGGGAIVLLCEMAQGEALQLHNRGWSEMKTFPLIRKIVNGVEFDTSRSTFICGIRVNSEHPRFNTRPKCYALFMNWRTRRPFFVSWTAPMIDLNPDDAVFGYEVFEIRDHDEFWTFINNTFSAEGIDAIVSMKPKLDPTG